MRSFRFIHAADLHLDCPFKGLTGLPERLRSDIRDSTFAALDRLVELALRERVHFVLFAGDIYEAKDRSLRAQLRFQQALEALAAAGIPAFIIHGNHDPLLEGYTAKLRLRVASAYSAAKRWKALWFMRRTGSRWRESPAFRSTGRR